CKLNNGPGAPFLSTNFARNRVPRALKNQLQSEENLDATECRRRPMHAHEILKSHPHVRGHANNALIRCIEESYSGAQICTACADACLAEQMVEDLRPCIRLNLDCADICNVTGRIATRF